MENNEQNKVPHTWADVEITPEMPLGMLINFMNILNQRLVNIENNADIEFNGETITLTEYYRRLDAAQGE